MALNEKLTIRIGQAKLYKRGDESGLERSFALTCRFLFENPERLSWRGKSRPDLTTESGIRILADRFFLAYRRSDFPAQPSTVPDQIVSEVMKIAYNYTDEECNRIKVEHQLTMCAENCVGAILERYLDSVIRIHNWAWCCGDFVRAVDFLKMRDDGSWIALQIKNRDNSENSSAAAIRNGTPIKKWFRSFSRTGRTNWADLPSELRDYGLSEEGFVAFVSSYLQQQKNTRS